MSEEFKLKPSPREEDLPPEEPGEQIFQVGIVATKQVPGDVIVRVRASNLAVAQQKALLAVQMAPQSLFEKVAFEEHGYPCSYDVETISRNDYSDMSANAFPHPDLDLTEEEK